MRLAPLALLLPLAGCPAFTASNIPSTATAIESQLDMTINNLILQKAMDIHNLGVALAQINATPGMVSVVMPAPVVAQPSPAPVTMTPAPAPIAPVGGAGGMVIPPMTGGSTPVGSFPTSPIVTPP